MKSSVLLFGGYYSLVRPESRVRTRRKDGGPSNRSPPRPERSERKCRVSPEKACRSFLRGKGLLRIIFREEDADCMLISQGLMRMSERVSAVVQDSELHQSAYITEAQDTGEQEGQRLPQSGEQDSPPGLLSWPPM